MPGCASAEDEGDPVRIAVVVTSFPSVSQTFVLNQITGLIDRGHEVDVYASASEEGGGAEHDDVRDYRLAERVRYTAAMAPGASLPRRVVSAARVLARYWWRDPGAAWRAARSAPGRYGNTSRLALLYRGAPFAGRGAYDAVLCHFGPNGQRTLALREAGILHGRIVTVFHGYDMSRYLAVAGTHIYGQLFADGDLFLPVSEFWRRRLIALGCPPEKIAVHHMGIELAKFPLWPRRIDRGRGTVRILTVARLVEKKGVEYAIRAVAALRYTTTRRVEYRVIGDGPLRARLEQLVDELDAGDVVRLEGEKDQGGVGEAMRQAHLFLAPSVTADDGDMEGIPVSIMEAMACGLPVVSTLHSGIPELVHDRVSGLLVPERDVDSLERALRYLVDQPRQWRKMGIAGRGVVESEYNVDLLNDRLVELLAGKAVRDGRSEKDTAGVGDREVKRKAAVEEDGVAEDEPKPIAEEATSIVIGKRGSSVLS